jgi:hypothetical protein
MLTFIVPVRHPENSRNWQQLKSLLAQTATAISKQEGGDWRAVVVANTGADLPELPVGFQVKRVDFPPNPKHELGKDNAEKEAVYDAFRYDKGRRVLAGMLQLRDSDYFMIVDDDDVVSCKLARFVASHAGASGWYIKNGYVWTDGGRGLYRHPSFHKFCGTSHIVRTDLMELPETFEQATPEYIKQMLGSHLFLGDYLRKRGNPLTPLPFVGAVYRIGHPGAHSKSSSLLRTFVLQESFIRRPWVILRNMFRMRVVTARLRREYFGT